LGTSTNFWGIAELAGQYNVATHIRSWSNILASPALLSCPSDVHPPAPSMASLTDGNISYFFNADPKEPSPRAFLLGDRNVTTNGVATGRGWTVVPAGAVISWTAAIHHLRANVVQGDGSVQQYLSALLTSPREERWVIP
jgi:hypothetical protein